MRMILGQPMPHLQEAIFDSCVTACKHHAYTAAHGVDTLAKVVNLVKYIANIQNISLGIGQCLFRS